MEVRKGSGKITRPPEAKKDPGAAAGLWAVKLDGEVGDAPKLTGRGRLTVQ